MQQQNEQMKQPFFSRFLECQLNADDREVTSPWKDYVTQKYPSDGDDNPTHIED